MAVHSRSGALALALLVTLAGATAASAAPVAWDFAGSWPLAMKCGTFEYVNTLKVTVASSTKVLGTTTTKYGVGHVVGGTFDGTTANFLNKYRYNGKPFSETWTARLSQNGTVVRGIMVPIGSSGGNCSFSGTRGPG